MLGSSSTTRSRASGVARPAGELPATVPPVARAEAIVMAASVARQAGAALDATCELPGDGLSGGRYGLSGGRHGLSGRRHGLSGGRHRPAPSPVPDRVVLRPSQAPAPT